MKTWKNHSLVILRESKKEEEMLVALLAVHRLDIIAVSLSSSVATTTWFSTVKTCYILLNNVDVELEKNNILQLHFFFFTFSSRSIGITVDLSDVI